MESTITRALSHLHPLDFSLSDLSSLTSAQLSLVQFHVEADSFDPSIPLKVFREWSQRRERSRGRLRSLPSPSEQDTQLHTIDLSFELSNLNQLDSNQLAVVQFHPECTELLQLKAEMIWRSRRERDFSRGFVWKDEKPEVTDVTQRKKVDLMEVEATSPPAEHSMEVIDSSLSKCAEDGTLQRPEKESEMEIQTENASRRDGQEQPLDESTPPRPDEIMNRVIQEPSLPPSSPGATPEKALSPPFVPSPTSPTTYAPLSRPSTPPSQVVASAPLALGFKLPTSPITALPQKISPPRKTASRSPSASPELIILATPYPPPSKSLPPPSIAANLPRPALPPIPPRPWGSTPLTLQFSSLIYSLRLFNLPSLEVYESSSLLSLFPTKLKPIASNLRPLPPQEFLRHGYVGFPTFDARTEAFQAVTGKRLLGGNHLISVEFVEDVEWEWRNLNYEWAEGVWRREMRRKSEVEQKEKEEVEEREREERERREVEVAEKFPAPTIMPEPSVGFSSEPASQETTGPLVQPLHSVSSDVASIFTDNQSSISTTNLASSRPCSTPSAILEAPVLPPTLTNKFPQLFITFSSPPLQVQRRAPFQLLGLASIIGIQPDCEGPKCRMFFLAFESREHLTIARERLVTKYYAFLKEYGMRVQLKLSEDWKIDMFTWKFRKVIVRELADRGSSSTGARLPTLSLESSGSLSSTGASSLLPALPISPTTVAPSVPFIPSALPSLPQQTLLNALPISIVPTSNPTLDTHDEHLPPPSLPHLPTPIIPSFDPTLDTDDRLLPNGWKRRWSITHSTWYYLDSEERSRWSNPLDEEGGSRSGSDMDVGEEEEVDSPRREEQEVDIAEESTPLEGISGDVPMQETAQYPPDPASLSLRIPPTTSCSTPIASPTLPTGPRIPRESPKDNAARYGYASSQASYSGNGQSSPSRIQGSSYFPSRAYPSGKFTPNSSYSNSGRGAFPPIAFNSLPSTDVYHNSTYARISAPLPTSFPPTNTSQNSQSLSSLSRHGIPSSPGKSISTGPSHQHHQHHHQTSHHPLPIRPQFVPSPPPPHQTFQSSTPPYPRSHADSSSSYYNT